MTEETLVSDSVQHPPPTRFVRKGRDSHKSPLCAESEPKSVQSESNNASDEYQKDLRGNFKMCPPRNRGTTSRAQYNKLMGEVNRDEAQAYIENDSSIDFARLEELLFRLSADQEENS